MARHLGLPEIGSDRIAEDASRAAQAALAQQGSPAQLMNHLAAELGDPARDAERDVYLVTVSRVLPDALDQTDLADVEATSSEGVGRALLGALNGNGGGVVKKMAVFKPPGRDPARAGGAPTRCDLPRSALGPLRGPRAGRVAGRRDVAPRLGFHCPGDHESSESLQETQRSTASVPLDFLKQDVLSRVSTAWSSLHWRVKRNLCRRRHSSCVVVIRFASSSSCVVVFFCSFLRPEAPWAQDDTPECAAVPRLGGVESKFQEWELRSARFGQDAPCALVQDHEKCLRQANILAAMREAGRTVVQDFPKSSPDLNAIEGAGHLLRQRLEQTEHDEVEGRAEFLARLRRTVRWLNEDQAEALQEMRCNQKKRAADVFELNGAKTEW